MRITYLILLLSIYGCTPIKTINNFSEMKLYTYRFNEDVSVEEFKVLKEKEDFLELVDSINSFGMIIYRKIIPKYESENLLEERYEYKNNRITSYIKYAKDSIPIEKKQYTYEDKKTILTNFHYKKYMETGSFSGKSIKTYNEKEQLINEVFFDCYNFELSTDKYTYSNDSVLIESVYKKSNLISRRCLQIVNKNGNIIEEQINSDLIDNNDKNLPQKWKYEYNQNNDLISSLYYFNNDLLETKKLSYEYLNDFWIKKTEEINDNIYTTIRTKK